MPKDRPNIVLIMFDQMRHNSAGFAGDPVVQTPVMDKIARDGVVFDNAFCASPVCSPARACWLTGLYPHTTTQLTNYGSQARGRWGYCLPKDMTTLGDVLKTEGYRCGMVGPWHMGDDETPQHGFTDYWYPHRYTENPEETDTYFQYLKERNLMDKYYQDKSNSISKYWNNGEDPTAISMLPTEHQRTSWTVERCIDFIQEDGDPYFIFMSIKDPHPHLVPPKECADLYDPSDMPLSEIWDDELEGKPSFVGSHRNRAAPKYGTDLMRIIVARYYALITHIDRQLGRFFAALESKGEADNTIVAIISDHGELLFDFGLWGKGFFYEGSVKVPCLLRWPGRISDNSRIAEPFAGVDLAPTLIELAGAPIPSPMHGRSWADVLLGKDEPAENTVLSEILWLGPKGALPDDDKYLAGSIMIRRGKWKLLRHRFDPLKELYDLEADPLERNNLAGDPGHAGKVQEMNGKIKTILKSQGAGPYSWCLED